MFHYISTFSYSIPFNVFRFRTSSFGELILKIQNRKVKNVELRIIYNITYEQFKLDEFHLVEINDKGR